MDMEIQVFDVETANFFTTPGVGWNNFEALKVSAIGIYSYARGKYFCFDEHELGEAADLMRAADLLVGFSSNRYDVPVLNVAFRRLEGVMSLNLFEKERLDLLDEIERVSGRRVSLNLLAEANLGTGKISSGAEAIELYRQGKIEELKAYCLKDVELTKKIYDLYRERKFLYLPNKGTREMTRVDFLAQPAAQGTLLL